MHLFPPLLLAQREGRRGWGGLLLTSAWFVGQAPRWEDTLGQLKDSLAASQVSWEAAESRVQLKEGQLQGLQRKGQSLHQELKMVQREVPVWS